MVPIIWVNEGIIWLLIYVSPDSDGLQASSSEHSAAKVTYMTHDMAVAIGIIHYGLTGDMVRLGTMQMGEL